MNLLAAPPTALDAVYTRAFKQFEEDREAFRREQPLLARAFDQIDPGVDQSTALSVFDRRIQELEGQLREQRAEAQARQDAQAERERLLKKDLAGAEHRAVVLAEEVARLTGELERQPKFAPAEAETLAGLGWRKETL